MPRTLFRRLSVGLVLTSLLTVAPFNFSPRAAQLVHAADTYVTLNQFAGYPGVTLTVSGGGYTPGESIALTAGYSGSMSPIGLSVASATGEFGPVNVVIPVNAPQGSFGVTATGATSAMSAMNAYYVQPFAPSIEVTADYNTPGNQIMISGSGFAPGEAVNVVFAGASMMTTASSEGAIADVALTIPNVVAGVYNPTAVGQASSATALTYFYVGGYFPSAYPSSYYTLAQQELSFSGGGFAPNETITVTEGFSATALASFKASATGSFSEAGAFTIPSSYAGSTRSFTLTGATSAMPVVAMVTIGQYFPNIYPSQYYIMPGKELVFSGGGFAPNEVVNVYRGLETTAAATFTTDEDGVFTEVGGVTIPVNAGGSSASFRLVGQNSSAEGTVTVTVGQFFANVSPDAYYVMPGSTLTFSGWGFAAGENVDVMYGTPATKVATAIADEDGGFTAMGEVVIPASASGTTRTYTLKGETSLATVSIEITVGQLYPQLSPSSYYIRPSETFSVDGWGFIPGETVTMKVGTQTIIGTAGTELLEAGVVRFTGLTAPKSSATGSFLITATGSLSEATAESMIALGSYYAYASADSYYLSAGTDVTVTGFGFAPNEEVVVTLGSATETVLADEFGNTPEVVLTVPFGILVPTVMFEGATSGATASLPLTLAPYSAQVSPSTWYATPGSPVSFEGTGFAPGETVAVTRNATALTTIVADEDGAFALNSQTLPFGTSADYAFTGSMSAATASVSVTLSQFYAGLQLSTYYAAGGSAIDLIGSGFAPNESVALTFAGSNLGSVAADAFGAFTFSTTVPFGTPGSKEATATGALSGVSAITAFTQSALYSLTLEMGSYAGKPGTDVTFIGSGFFASEPVSVTSDRTSGTLFTFTTGVDGSLNGVGMLPAGLAEGPITFTVTGGHSMTPKEITFYVQPL